MVKVRDDLTGRTFGRLKVIKQVEDHIQSNGRHVAMWECICSCEDHNTVFVIGDSLKGGKTTSCGCLHKECISKIGIDNKIGNQYDLSGEYGVGWTSNTNKEFYFDLEDYDKIKEYTWYENIDQNNYHSLRAYDEKSNIKIIMSWIICGKFFDHNNLNPLDNRKQNLRPATTIENARNHSKQKNNTSGFIGVYFRKRDQKWCIQINFNKKHILIGAFNNKKDAIVERLKAEKKYYGEFAPQRHLFEQYGINMEENK